jgi:hypothetical protein
VGGGRKGVLDMLELACARGQMGPLGVKTPVALGSTKRAGNGGNKTQVALHLVNQLPKPPPGHSYHVFLDNLFASIKMVEYARSIGIVVTGTCRDTGGII